MILTRERSFDIYLGGDCGGTGYSASTLYRYWDYNSQSETKRRESGTVGGKYQRATGKKVQIIGSLINRGSIVENYGKSHSIDIDNNFIKGKSYEFIIQHLAASFGRPNVLGSGITFVFQPDNNATMTIKPESFFSLTRTPAL